MQAKQRRARRGLAPRSTPANQPKALGTHHSPLPLPWLCGPQSFPGPAVAYRLKKEMAPTIPYPPMGTGQADRKKSRPLEG